VTRATDPLIGKTFGEFVLRERDRRGRLLASSIGAIQPGLDREGPSSRCCTGKLPHDRRRRIDSCARPSFASRLDHPYAAHIYAFGLEPDGGLWISMEMVPWHRRSTRS